MQKIIEFFPKKMRYAVFSFIIVSSFPLSLRAATTSYWQPETGTNSWFTESNWSAGVPSSAGTNGYINALGVCSIDQPGATALRLHVGDYRSDTNLVRAVVESGASLQVTELFAVGRNNTSHGQLTIKGDVTSTANWNFLSSSEDAWGEVIVDGGALSILSANLSVGSMKGEGFLTLNSGLVTNANTASFGDRSDTTNAYGRLEVNGGRYVTPSGIYFGKHLGHGEAVVNGGEIDCQEIQIATYGDAPVNGITTYGEFYQHGGQVTADTLTMGIDTWEGVGRFI